MGIFRAAEVAGKLRISKQTLFRYEKKGIFPKPRRNRINRWREYNEEEIQKMKQIMGRGFTLLELIIVVVIMGILSALAIPRFESFYTVKLKGAVNNVVSDIRYVQQLAASSHDTYKMTFYVTPANRYEVQKSDNSYAKNPFGHGDFIINFTNDPQYKGIGIDSANINGMNILSFDWNGTPRDANGNTLTAEGQVNLSYQNDSFSVRVTPNTGWVRVQ